MHLRLWQDEVLGRRLEVIDMLADDGQSAMGVQSTRDGVSCLVGFTSPSFYASNPTLTSTIYSGSAFTPSIRSLNILKSDSPSAFVSSLLSRNRC